ncbi:tail protein [Vibrio phage Ceto]|uniref:Major tail protein n=1 Tax=Vibrio phage Ceto TaxID=2570300 RepID=A0A2H5BGC1_9CAUD|nr:tail protein [Vibrio phage Ceto]AUG85036.1 major tail protein [Vibrio phage Ceto]
MSVQLLRNTRLWASIAKPGETLDKTNTWEVLIQEDFAFNQDGNSTDINLDEAGPRPTRGSKRFNDNLNPADWNFSTYLRPYLSDAGTSNNKLDDVVLTPDYALWHCLASGSPVDITNEDGVKANSTNMLVSFKDNQYHQLNTLTLFYLVDNVWYKIHDVQINQAEISMDIEGIGMTAWSGQGTKVEPLGTTQPFDPNSADFTFPDDVFETAPYIKNKLTTLFIKDNKDDVKYDIPITGGSITINNNISYLTPNTLSRLDLPIGSFTGTFEVSGSLEAYLRNRESGDSQDRAAELLNKMITDRSITNSFQIGICLGGVYPNANASTVTKAPGVVIVLPTAHLSVPSTETADVLGTSIEFKGIPTELDAGDEVYIGMSPAYTAAQIQALIERGDGARLSAPPGITTQPANQTLTTGEQLQLSVAASDASRYQWYKDGAPISGATSSTYTKSSAALSDSGKYYVEAYNSEGSKTTSNTITVTVS